MTRTTTRAIAMAFVASMVLALVGPAAAGAAATGDLAVTTEEPTDVAETSATLHGNLTSLGNATSADVSFEYWAEGDAENASTVDAGTTNATGTFEATASGLEPNTTYVVVAEANASEGVATGENVTFTTDDAFDVRTLEPADVTNTSATLRGELVDLGGSENATVWFEYWSQDGSGEATETASHVVNATGVFEATIGNLSANETYVYVAYAQPADGEAEAGGEVTIGESADDEPAEGPFGQRLTRYLHELIGSSVDGPPGQTISKWVVANNPGADNRPDHAGPDDERGPPDHASDEGESDRGASSDAESEDDEERGPPEHANDDGADETGDGENQEDGDEKRGPPEHANNDEDDGEDDDEDN